jgi:hypothetical protein
MRNAAMPTFEVYIDDDRYAVPSLYLISVGSEAAARAAVQRLLDESPHHQGVELRCEGERIFGAGSYAKGESLRADARPIG